MVIPSYGFASSRKTLCFGMNGCNTFLKSALSQIAARNTGMSMCIAFGALPPFMRAIPDEYPPAAGLLAS